MTHPLDMTDADIQELDADELVDLIDRCDRNADPVNGASMLAKIEYRKIAAHARQCLQSINLKSEKSFNDMIAGQ